MGMQCQALSLLSRTEGIMARATSKQITGSTYNFWIGIQKVEVFGKSESPGLVF